MLDFLRSSIALVKEDSSANTTNEIAAVLRRLRDSRKKIFIQFEGENVTYACNIGAFNLEHRVIVVNDLCTDIPMTSLHRGRAVTVIVREGGSSTSFDCSYLEPLIENQNSALQIQLPKSLAMPARKQIHSLLGGTRV